MAMKEIVFEDGGACGNGDDDVVVVVVVVVFAWPLRCRR